MHFDTDQVKDCLPSFHQSLSIHPLSPSLLPSFLPSLPPSLPPSFLPSLLPSIHWAKIEISYPSYIHGVNHTHFLRGIGRNFLNRWKFSPYPLCMIPPIPYMYLGQMGNFNIGPVLSIPPPHRPMPLRREQGGRLCPVPTAIIVPTSPSTLCQSSECIRDCGIVVERVRGSQRQLSVSNHHSQKN